MKKLTLATAFALAFSASYVHAQEEAPAMSELERISYAIGINMGASLNDSGIEIDPTLVLEGLTDGLQGNDPKMSEEEIVATLNAFQQKVMAQQQAKAQAAASENREAGTAFLAENGQRAGISTTESGLQYEVITAGDGPTPGATDSVKVHYTGTLIDGTKFDSSVDRGQPATFRVDQVIAGWTEAMQLMPVGSKWKLYIPADLAYGDRAGGPIPPGSVLIFDVELLGIE